MSQSARVWIFFLLGAAAIVGWQFLEYKDRDQLSSKYQIVDGYDEILKEHIFNDIASDPK